MMLSFIKACTSHWGFFVIVLVSYTEKTSAAAMTDPVSEVGWFLSWQSGLVQTDSIITVNQPSPPEAPETDEPHTYGSHTYETHDEYWDILVYDDVYRLNNRARHRFYFSRNLLLLSQSIEPINLRSQRLLQSTLSLRSINEQGLEILDERAFSELAFSERASAEHAFADSKEQSTGLINEPVNIEGLTFFSNATAIPEPSSLGLLSLGLAGLIFTHRRKFKALNTLPSTELT